ERRDRIAGLAGRGEPCPARSDDGHTKVGRALARHHLHGPRPPASEDRSAAFFIFFRVALAACPPVAGLEVSTRAGKPPAAPDIPRRAGARPAGEKWEGKIMTRKFNPKWMLGAAIAAAAGLYVAGPAAASAAVLSDSFTDGDRTADPAWYLYARPIY